MIMLHNTIIPSHTKFPQQSFCIVFVQDPALQTSVVHEIPSLYIKKCGAKQNEIEYMFDCSTWVEYVGKTYLQSESIEQLWTGTVRKKNKRAAG